MVAHLDFKTVQVDEFARLLWCLAIFDITRANKSGWLYHKHIFCSHASNERLITIPKIVFLISCQEG